MKYLLTEGFHLFSLTYSKPKKKAWIEYSPVKTISSKNTTEEEFENVSLQEFVKCKELYSR